MQVSQSKSTYKDRRLTRNFRSSTSVRTTIPLLSKLNRKTTCRRGSKRGSGKKKKKAVKVNFGVVKKNSYFTKICVYYCIIMLFYDVINFYSYFQLNRNDRVWYNAISSG